jgi:hypothetical protein
MKACVKCGEVKPLTLYHRKTKGRDGHRNDCKACVSLDAASRYLGHRDFRISQNRAYYHANKPKVRARVRQSKLSKQYGLTQESFDALVLAQGGCCAICGKKAVGRFNIDHDHDTGEVRGLLCGPCNRGIGLLGDSVDTLKLAVTYLETKLGKV